MDSVPGWDPRLLNKEMIEMLRRDSADTAERIETSPYHRWQEGHKKSIDKLADGITELAYQALALQCIITCVPACETTGSGEDNRGGRSTKVTSNLGNEIDITPSSNHSTVPKNPGPKGTPSSSVDILDNAGNVATRRWYDSNGNAYRDVDMTNHGNPKTHREHPHEYTWDWSSGNPKRSK